MVKKIAVLTIVILACVIAGVLYYCIPQKNDDGRIDIYNVGNRNNNITCTKMSSSISDGGGFNNPQWLDEPGNGKIFNFSPKYLWQEGEITFTANGSGKIRIDILGAYRQIENENGKLEKVFVEYKDFDVNGKSIIKEPKILWHNDREIHLFPAKNNEIYTIKFKYKKPLPFQTKGK